VKTRLFYLYMVQRDCVREKASQLSSLRSVLSEKARTFPDNRQEGKVDHSVHDVVMCAFSMMYFQDPSLLQFQKRMEEAKQTSNMKTLFQVQSIPRDTQIRKCSMRSIPIPGRSLFRLLHETSTREAFKPKFPGQC